ncbi:hypothetical protein KIH77_08810 [Bifidobacterium sp. 82T24]|nr:hypothetical protein [Bifidobacterium pluvialisilvae]
MELTATRTASRLWNKVRTNDITASWKPLSLQLIRTLTLLQAKAADTAVAANTMMLAQQGDYVEPLALANTTAFGGYTAQGQPLTDALEAPMTATLHAISQGTKPTQAMEIGRQLLTLITALAVNDAANSAAQTDTALRPGVQWVRVEAPGCCDRCMILAGKTFRWNQGFLRHPHCHGRHVPITDKDRARANGLITDPMETFHSLSPEQQDKTFGKANAQAIRDGADISQVVNAKRGMEPIGQSKRAKGYKIMTTTEGTTRYGWSNMIATRQGRTQKRRLTPEGIYALAKDRDQAVRLLEREGYVLPKDWRSQAPEIRRGMWLHNNDWRQGRHETMTAAQKRLQTALLRYEAALEGRSPYRSNAPATPEELARAENEYRRWKTTRGQIFTQ